MAGESKGISIPRKCLKVIFVFRPIYNVSSPSYIEWVFHYMLDWGIDVNAYDMAKVRYKIYDNVGTTWDVLSGEGHMFLNNHNSTGMQYDCFIGHQCNQVYHIKLAYDSKYLDTGGLVRVALCFDTNIAAGVSELQEVANPSKTDKRSEMSVYFNSMEIY